MHNIFCFTGLVLFLTSFPKVLHAQGCAQLAEQGDCSFYRQCVENRVPCGANGYAISYGEEYCKRFQMDTTCFDSQVYSCALCCMHAILRIHV